MTGLSGPALLAGDEIINTSDIIKINGCYHTPSALCCYDQINTLQILMYYKYYYITNITPIK